MNFITVNSVSKVYKVKQKQTGYFSSFRNFFYPDYHTIRAINNISFNIDTGEAVGFIGPNGAGKSTMIKMLTGILVPDQGNIHVDGIDPLKNRRQNAKKMGVVFGQKTQLWWDLPIIDTFQLLKAIYQIDDYVYKQNINIFNDILELHNFVNQPVRQLSLGQRMRADIAAAFLHNPKLVYLDEPTIGLDIIAKEKIRNFLVEINKEWKTTILFTTHDMSDISATCKRVIIIDKGELIYNGSIDSMSNIITERKMVSIVLSIPYPNFSSLIREQEFALNLHIDEESDIKKTIKFDNKKISTSHIVSFLSDQFKISDLTIQDASIEDIVRKYYESNNK